MAQYCRYCSHFFTGNGNWCEVKEIQPSDSYAKSTNHCKEFELNPIDAYFENPNEYTPREYKPRKRVKKNYEQLKMY